MEIILFLVQNKYVKPKRLNGDYLLLACERNKNLDIIKYLIKISNKNDYGNYYGNNIIMMSCFNENVEVLCHISKKFKNNMYQVNDQGKNALDIAIGNKNIKILKYLVNELNYNYFQFNHPSFRYLWEAIYSLNLETLKYLINLKFDVNDVDNNKCNLLEKFEQHLDNLYCDFDYYDKDKQKNEKHFNSCLHYFFNSNEDKHNLKDYLKIKEIYKYLLEEVRIKKTCEINKGKTLYYKFYYVYKKNILNELTIPEKILKIILKLNFNNFSL